jgi:hypothetical protein
VSKKEGAEEEGINKMWFGRRRARERGLPTRRRAGKAGKKKGQQKGKRRFFASFGAGQARGAKRRPSSRRGSHKEGGVRQRWGGAQHGLLQKGKTKKEGEKKKKKKGMVPRRFAGQHSSERFDEFPERSRGHQTFIASKGVTYLNAVVIHEFKRKGIWRTNII